MVLNIAFIGFGVVGQGLAQILVSEAESLRRQRGFEFRVVAIADKVKGSVYDPRGLDLTKLLALVERGARLDEYPSSSKGLDSIKTITDTDANVIVEVTWTDLRTGEPAMTHIKTALARKKHVITTNKGPIALAAKELLSLAKKNGVQLRFEGTVMSGTPVISLGTRNLAGCQIRAVRGIVNGTTNFILTEMERGLSYANALAQAQKLGYAEADPSADVEGHDALAKVLILANTILGGSLVKDQVPCQGITGITAKDIQQAKAERKRWKLIAAAALKESGGVEAYVRPEKIPFEHPLASVSGATNALTFVTKYLGEVTIVGPGAGQAPTGFALLSDLLDIHRTLAK
jgi:homoserine dehydrogenase